jgi:hypothetical protein
MNDNLRESIVKRHHGAHDVLARYDDKGLPFVLYLRDFHYQLHVGSPDGRQPIHKAIAARLPSEVDIFYIQNQRVPWLDAGKARGNHEGASAFLLGDEHRESDVAYLIQRASMIVFEVGLLGVGSSFELGQICNHSQVHKAILILPGTDEPLKPLDGD